MVTGVHTILCEVKDMNVSVAFYTELLGAAPEIQSPYWTHYVLGGIRIGLHPPFAASETITGGGWILGLQTNDIRTVNERLTLAGVSVSDFHDTPSGAILDFTDPDGHRLQMIQLGISVKDLV